MNSPSVCGASKELTPLPGPTTRLFSIGGDRLVSLQKGHSHVVGLTIVSSVYIIVYV